MCWLNAEKYPEPFQMKWLAGEMVKFVKWTQFSLAVDIANYNCQYLIFTSVRNVWLRCRATLDAYLPWMKGMSSTGRTVLILAIDVGAEYHLSLGDKNDMLRVPCLHGLDNVRDNHSINISLLNLVPFGSYLLWSEIHWMNTRLIFTQCSASWLSISWKYSLHLPQPVTV